MPASTEPRSSLFFGWPYGEDGWNSGMDANLLRVGRYAFHLSVKTRALSTPPGSPAAGDAYIVGAAATDAWAGLEGRVVVWVPGTPAGAWESAAPRRGWIAYIEDEDLQAVFSTSWQVKPNRNEVQTQGAPTDKTATATLTIAELLTKIVTVTSASAVALTLPTGTLIDAGVTMQTNTAFEWSVINLGSSSGAVTMTASTGHTYSGNATVAIGTTARFRTRKTAANTFVTYRIG